MDFIPGERVSGKIEKINSDGLVILLRDDIRGFVSQDFLEDLDEDKIREGKEVNVIVRENGKDDYVKLEIDNIFSEGEKLEEGSESCLKNINLSSKNNKEKVENNENEDLFNWFSRTEVKLEEIRKHRSDRLSEDYYQD